MGRQVGINASLCLLVHSVQLSKVRYALSSEHRADKRGDYTLTRYASVHHPGCQKETLDYRQRSHFSSKIRTTKPTMYIQKLLISAFTTTTSLAAQIENSSTLIQAANFNVSTSTAAQYGCKGDCYTVFTQGLLADQALYGVQYNASFYATASNFSNSTSSPGDLLKFSPIDPSLLSGVPPGITAYRMQYVSIDIRGQIVPVTGFVALPFANRTNGHVYQAVAYAHGTSGVFPGCAPSAMPDLYEYGSWGWLVERGYVVIATDYAGLGNNYTAHPYLEFRGHANDVYYSVMAARKVLGKYLTEDWMSVGHSQGGGTVWQLSESSLVLNNHTDTCNSSWAGPYLGTIAQAPAVLTGTMAITAIMDALTSNSSDTTSAGSVITEFAYAVLNLRITFPDLSFDFLAEPFKQRLQLAEIAQACYASLEALLTDLDIEDIVDLDSEEIQPLLEKLDALSSTGNSKAEQPILVVQGLTDESVLAKVVELAYEQSCEKGNSVQLQEYEGVLHDPVILISAPYAGGWIDALFDGTPEEKSCSKVEIKSIDAANLYMPDDD